MGRDATPRGMRRRVRAGDALRIGGEVWRIGVWPCGAQLTAESTGDVVRARVRHGGYPCGEGVVWCQDVGRGDGARIELWCHAPDDVVIEHIKSER